MAAATLLISQEVLQWVNNSDIDTLSIPVSREQWKSPGLCFSGQRGLSRKQSEWTSLSFPSYWRPPESIQGNNQGPAGQRRGARQKKAHTQIRLGVRLVASIMLQYTASCRFETVFFVGSSTGTQVVRPPLGGS